MGERRHADVDTQGNVGALLPPSGDVGNALELEERVDDDRTNARLDGELDLGDGLGDAVEDDLPRAKAARNALISSPPALTSTLMPLRSTALRNHRLEQALLA